MNSCKSSGNRRWRCNTIAALVLAVHPVGEIAVLDRIADGDSIWVFIDGKRVGVRYLAINAPELDTECGKQAAKVNQELLKGKQLRLVADDDVSNSDRYDRLLRYVYADGVLVNAELVKRGMAEARLYEPGIDRYPEFKALEREAKAVGKGCL